MICTACSMPLPPDDRLPGGLHFLCAARLTGKRRKHLTVVLANGETFDPGTPVPDTADVSQGGVRFLVADRVLVRRDGGSSPPMGLGKTIGPGGPPVSVAAESAAGALDSLNNERTNDMDKIQKIEPYVPEGGWTSASTNQTQNADPPAEPQPRTRLIIAKELDADEKALNDAEALRAGLKDAVARLTRESRTFGVRRRAKKEA